MSSRRVETAALPWVLRAGWAVLPLTAGPGFADALDGRSQGVQNTASVALWAVWGVLLLATLVLHPLSLTALRVLAPAGLVAAVAAGAGFGVTHLGLFVGVLFTPQAGVLFVNGPAYPNERRFLLRAPGPVLSGLLQMTWLLAVVPPVTGVLLVAAGRVAAGVGLLVVALPVAAVLARAMHTLSRRWVVFVPAGFVLHDPLSLVDPVLFQKRTIDALQRAPADTDSLDLTRGSFGLALELLLNEKVPMTLVRPGRGGVPEQGASARLLFTPTLPDDVLAEARTRSFP